MTETPLPLFFLTESNRKKTLLTKVLEIPEIPNVTDKEPMKLQALKIGNNLYTIIVHDV